MSWVATHLDWLIGAAWAVVEIWRGKGRGKAKALETAKELAHRAKELDLERQRAALERSMEKLKEQADDVPAWAQSLQARLEKAGL